MARRIGVTGGRHYTGSINAATVFAVMKRLADEDPDTVIVEGGATGADWLCVDAAKALGLRVETHRAEWDRGGKGEGPKRNQRMVDSGLNLLIAFPGGRGTADMVRRAKAAGVPVEEVKP